MEFLNHVEFQKHMEFLNYVEFQKHMDVEFLKHVGEGGWNRINT